KHFSPGRSGAGHLERCLSDLWTSTTLAADESDVAGLLREVARVARKRRFVVVVSDEPTAGPELTSALRRLRAQHEVLVVVVEGMIATEVRGADGPSVRDVGVSGGFPGWLRNDAELARQADELRRSQREQLDATFERLRVAHCRLAGVDETVGALRDLFERHRRVGRR
ncbi:hypothetical protein, partial [Nocardioides sp.]|uniref:DUF58 domain-containing protein n=1 Tax=Nocardioides sp. TaxID=35761 RepID=UPI0025D558E2